MLHLTFYKYFIWEHSYWRECPLFWKEEVRYFSSNLIVLLNQGNLNDVKNWYHFKMLQFHHVFLNILNANLFPTQGKMICLRRNTHKFWYIWDDQYHSCKRCPNHSESSNFKFLWKTLILYLWGQITWLLFSVKQSLINVATNQISLKMYYWKCY